MGAWGYSPYQSDEGMDYFDEFLDSENKIIYLEDKMDNLLQIPFEEVGYHADDALISAEMIVGSKGYLSQFFYGEHYFEDREKPDFEELGKMVNKDLIEKAIKAVDRVLLYEKDNHEEWHEEDFGDREKEVLTIKARLELSLTSFH